MKRKSLIWKLLAIAAVVSPSSVSAEWLEAKTKHFDVYGDVSESDMRGFVERMERFDAALRFFIRPTETVPVTIYLVDTVSDVQKLAKRGRGLLAYYVPRYDGPIAVAPRRLSDSGSMSAQSVLFHEYAHHLLISNADQFYPGWMNEGLAEFFMTAKLDANGNVTIGAPNDDRKYSMTSANRWTAKELLESDSRKTDILNAEQRYSRGWLMTHYLLLGGERDGQLEKFVQLINSGQRPVEAGEKVFGDLKKLNSDLERYMRKSSIKVITLTPDDLKAEADIKIRKLSPAEAAIMPTRMTSTTGVDEELARSLVAKAAPIAAAYPNDSFVQRAYAEMQYDNKDYDGADASLNRALAADPKNFSAIVYKGRVAAMKASKSKNAAGWDEARSWFLKANKLRPNDPLPFVLYYDSYKAESATVPDAALQGLLRAIILVPQDTSVRTRTAIALIDMGDLASAQKILAATAYSAHQAPDNPFRKVLEVIESGASKQDVQKVVKELKFGAVNEFVQREKEKKDE